MGRFFICLLLFMLMITVEYEGKRIAAAIESHKTTCHAD